MGGMRLLSNSIPQIAGKVFSRKFVMLGRLATQWPEIVGKDLALKTQPVKIRYYKKKKQGEKATASLDIAVSSADATLLHYQKDLILERINQLFGERWITAIRFVPVASNSDRKPAPKRLKPLTIEEKSALSKLIENVEDKEIQERLKSLGSAILQDQKSRT